MSSPSVRCSIATLRDTTSLRSIICALQRLLARERQHALGELRAARGGFVDRLDDRRERRVAGELVGQNLGHPDDDGEDVVEVVRHAAGELADRLHLLRLDGAGSRA